MGRIGSGLWQLGNPWEEGFVENVEDELHEGQEVKVRIESVDLHAKRSGEGVQACCWPGQGGSVKV